MLQSLAGSRFRELSVLNGVNALLLNNELDLNDDVPCTGLTFNEINAIEGDQIGNTKNIDWIVDFEITCDFGDELGNISLGFDLTIPLEFTSNDFDTQVPRVALGNFVCEDDLVINGVDSDELCAEFDIEDELREIFEDLDEELLEATGPAIEVNNNFEADLDAALDALDNDGFRVIDGETLEEILIFFAEEIEGIDFIEDFLEVFQDQNADIEDILEAVEELLEEFGLEDLLDEYGFDDYDFDYDDDDFDYDDDDFDYEDFFPKKTLNKIRRKHVVSKLRKQFELPEEVEEFIDLFPIIFQDTLALLFFQDQALATSLAEDTFVDFIIGQAGFQNNEEDILRSFFGDASAIDVLTAIVQFDLSGLIELIDFNITPEFLILNVFQLDPELIDLLYPNGIPEEFGQQFVDIVTFIDGRLNGLVIVADEALSQEQVEILQFVALFDPLIADNLDDIVNGQVTGSDFFGFLELNDLSFEVGDGDVFITPVRAEFISNIQVQNVEDAVFELGVIQTPRLVVEQFTTTVTLEVRAADQVDLVEVTNDITAIFRIAAALVAGDDLTDIGLFGIEDVQDLQEVGEDAINCASSQVGASVLAVEQELTATFVTAFPDEADDGIESFINSNLELYAALIPQTVANALNEVLGVTTLEEDAEVADVACAQTSISQNLGDDDNLGLILGVVGAFVAIAALAAIIAAVVLRNKNSKPQQVPTAQEVPVKPGVVPDAVEKKTGVSY